GPRSRPADGAGRRTERVGRRPPCEVADRRIAPRLRVRVPAEEPEYGRNLLPRGGTLHSPQRPEVIGFDLFARRSSIIGSPTGRRRGWHGPVSNSLEAWVPRVYRFALRLSNDPDAADDLTQETFLRAWRQRDRLRDQRAARVWLFRITANLWRDHLRRGRSPVARAGPLGGTEPAPA